MPKIIVDGKSNSNKINPVSPCFFTVATASGHSSPINFLQFLILVVLITVHRFCWLNAQRVHHLYIKKQSVRTP